MHLRHACNPFGIDRKSQHTTCTLDHSPYIDHENGYSNNGYQKDAEGRNKK